MKDIALKVHFRDEEAETDTQLLCSTPKEKKKKEEKRKEKKQGKKVDEPRF